MAYGSPSTKEQMYQILEQIFLDYRNTTIPFEQVQLEDINLEKLEYVSKTEEDFLIEARKLLTPWYNEEYDKRIREIEEDIKVKQKQLDNLQSSLDERLASIEKTYLQAQEEMEAKALNYGFADSPILVSKLAKLQSEKATKINEANENFSVNSQNITYEIALLNEQSNRLLSILTERFSDKITAKVIELKGIEKEKEREILKYNNSIDEKLQKHRNSNISANANLQLKYLEIRSEGLTKDELIQRGYYRNVVECVGYFYNNGFSTPLEAYRDILNESQIMIYLDDYYPSMLEMYRMKAGL